MRATNARTEPMIPMRGHVQYDPLSRICAQNRAEFHSFALRIARRPHAVARRTYVTDYGTDGRLAECKPANGTGRVPDEPPLHLEGQELVQELVRDVGALSVVEEREKLLVGAADVQIGVVGQLEEAQVEERSDAHLPLAIQPPSPSRILFLVSLENLCYVHICIYLY